MTVMKRVSTIDYARAASKPTGRKVQFNEACRNAYVYGFAAGFVGVVVFVLSVIPQMSWPRVVLFPWTTLLVWSHREDEQLAMLLWLFSGPFEYAGWGVLYAFCRCALTRKSALLVIVSVHLSGVALVAADVYARR